MSKEKKGKRQTSDFLRNCLMPVLAGFTLLFLSACSKEVTETGAEPDDGDEAGGIHIIFDEASDGEEEELYQFKDVEGNEYEASLLESVPKCTYDFSHLVTDEETGYKSFEDEENGVTARFGIDVSEFQGEEIDWKQVKDSGVEFVLIRLGYRAYGDTGALVLDAMYEQNMENALEAGLDVGVYFFSQAISKEEAEEEARFVLEHLKGFDISGPVVYDTEDIDWDTARTDKNTAQDYTDFCRIFCDAVEAAGYETMIYSNLKWMAFTLDMEALTEYDFWYADYYDIPQCPYDYEIWQYSETGVVPGINANVDLNLWFEKTQEDE